MQQLSSMLKSKALLLEKEAWGYLSASLASTKMSGLLDILEGLFMECSNSEEEESQPPKKFCQEDKLSTSSEPSKSTPSSAPSPNTVIPVSEGSLHNSGISLEFLPICEQLSHRKAIYLCAFGCGHHVQSRVTTCTYL